MSNNKVFISYSHDSEAHAQQTLAFANQLRKDGVETILDQYIDVPPEGWPLWMERQMEKAEYVLIVCTKTYLQRVKGEEKPGTGKGVKWESLLTYSDIYESDSRNVKFIPVLFNIDDKKYIPKPLRSTNFYLVTDQSGYEKLYRRLTNQPSVVTPKVGAERDLGTTEVPDFFSTSTDNPTTPSSEPVPDRSAEREALREEVRKLVQRNRIKEALNTMLEKLHPDSDFSQAIDVQLNNWDSMNRSELLGIKSSSELGLERNKIVVATLNIVSNLKDNDLK